MFNTLMSVFADNQFIGTIALFSVAFTCLFCFVSLQMQAAKTSYVVFPVVGKMTERKALGLARLATSKGKASVAVRHIALGVCHYKVVQEKDFESKKRQFCFDASDIFEKIS